MADNYLGYKMDDYLAGRLKPAKKKKKVKQASPPAPLSTNHLAGEDACSTDTPNPQP